MEGPSCDSGPKDNQLLIDQQNMNATELDGILPRTALLLHNEVKKYASMGKKISYEVSAIEIYCENIRDLLCENDSPQYLELMNQGKNVICQ